MDSFGINLGYLLVQLLSLAILLGWVVLGIVSLIKLKKQPLNSTARAIWALIILGIPCLGAVVYLMIKPSD